MVIPGATFIPESRVDHTLSLLAGDEHNRKSKREFRLFNLREKIDWFKTLQEEQHPDLVTKFGISNEDLNELKHLGM